jgi:hypothetical protein
VLPYSLPPQCQFAGGILQGSGERLISERCNRSKRILPSGLIITTEIYVDPTAEMIKESYRKVLGE